MFEIVENNNSLNIENESETIKEIKGISSLNIKDYPIKKLKSLISKEKNFFYYIEINALKLFDNELIRSLSQELISNLTKDSLEKLSIAEKIKYLNENLLNIININLLPCLSKNFYKQINNSQFIKAKIKVIMKLVKCRKIEYLNELNIKYFYKSYFNSIKDIKDVKYLLNKKSKYLTSENFIHLGEYIGKTEELDHFFEQLKDFCFSDEDNDINTTFHKGVLDLKDIIKNNSIVIKQEEIKEKIENYLSDGESESYELLQNYCINCCEKEEDRILSINTLNEILNLPTYNIFQKIERFKILEILIVIDKDRENQLKNYINLLKLIREINNLQLSDPCEFDAKINFFSEIINKGVFNIDFLEMLAEENLRNIKYLFNTFFDGTDKTAIPENLRNQHVKIIKEYLEIIKKKYDIDEDTLINKLQIIYEDKENFEQKLNLYLKSISKHEKLYYDLMMQSIMEMPSFEKNIESKANTLFKFIRDIGITVLGAKVASLTGSKVLTSISVGIGVAKILKNIKDEVIKSYFSLSDNQKKLYLLNYKTTPQGTFSIISKKIKEGYRKIIIPIKKFTNNFIRNKILKLKKETKVGLDKYAFNFKDKKKLKEEMISYRGKYIDNYKEVINSTIEPIFIQNLVNIKEKLKDKVSKKQSQKLRTFFSVKDKMLKYLINKRKNKLKKKYPEFDDTFYNNSKNFFYNVKDFFVGTFNGLISSITFNYVDLRIKENKNQILEKLIDGVKFTNYKKELEKVNKYENDCALSTLKDEIEFMVKSSEDENIFKDLENEKIKTKEKLEKLINKLKNDIIDNNIENNIIAEEQENTSNDISVSSFDNLDDKNELLIKI